MKYPQQISMPSGIQLWLDEQLEARGVDSRVYSKYILSVLSIDSSELSVKTKDHQVRLLIDELRTKLKGLQEKGQFPKSAWDCNSQSHSEENFSYYSSNSKAKTGQINSSIGSSPSVWSGKRAFGSSIGKNRTVSEGNNRFNWLEEDKENNSYNRDAREKLRSRSTVKQQTPEKTSRNMAKSLDRKENVSRVVDNNKGQILYQQATESDYDFNMIWKNEKPVDDLTECDKDLPMDFQQLLESPESTKVSSDYSRLVGIKRTPSFIQCGTNITSSIWSEKAEDKMDCSTITETNNNVSSNLSFEKSAWGVMDQASFNKSATMQESSSMFNNSIWSSDISNKFNNDSWKTVGNSKTTLRDIGKWSDVEGTSLLINDADNFFSSIGSNLYSSLSTLNHNKEDSSFTEVIPKTQSGFFATKDVVKIEPVVNCKERSSSKKEEEDLLTSMKTHFRPIKHEVSDVVFPTNAPTFPDGTTFPISNQLDEPNFHKSPGGGLYLDSDVNNKYMEYNDMDDDTPSEFVPKFRVRQNEKFCQTDEFVPSAQNYAELECEEMYFPEDEKLVRSMVEEDELEEEDENLIWTGETCIKVDGWLATWPANGIWSNEPNVQQIWCGGNVVWNNSGESKSEGGGGGGGDGNSNSNSGEQYTNAQLRNEWTQEAEELLSDISQQLYLANYVDTQPPKAALVESAWNQLSSATFARAVPVPPPPSYSLMQS